jgi:hypothetical protein
MCMHILRKYIEEKKLESGSEHDLRSAVICKAMNIWFIKKTQIVGTNIRASASKSNRILLQEFCYITYYEVGT